MRVRDRLLRLLREKSLRLGRFKLASGMTSHYYFDSKLTTLDPEGAYLTAKALLSEIKARGIQADLIGGLTLGADPIVAAVAAVSFAERDEYRPLGAFIVRKDAKSHGTERFIEGVAEPQGRRVIIIDDVCTTGGSTRVAIERAEAAGMTVAAVLCLVDREQGARENLAGHPFYPIFSASELLASPEIQERLRALSSSTSS